MCLQALCRHVEWPGSIAKRSGQKVIIDENGEEEVIEEDSDGMTRAAILSAAVRCDPERPHLSDGLSGDLSGGLRGEQAGRCTQCLGWSTHD